MQKTTFKAFCEKKSSMPYFVVNSEKKMEIFYRTKHVLAGTC